MPDATTAPPELFPLREAPRRPWLRGAGRAGKAPSYFALVRHAVHGRAVGGRTVKLKSLMINGVRCTCDAWLLQFFGEVTAAADANAAPTPTPASSRRGKRAHELAESVLDAAGVK